MLQRVRGLIEEGIEQSLHIGAQVCVSLRGEVLGDLAVGRVGAGTDGGGPGPALRSGPAWGAVTGDSIALWLSSGKPITGVAIAQLVEHGEIEWDDPVAGFLPTFASQDKGDITVRHLLTHTGGFRTARFKFPQDDWDTIIAAICDAPPEVTDDGPWVIGEDAGYHAQTSWFILGELVRHVDGRPIDQYVREEIFLPLGMADSWMGMPPEVFRGYEQAGRIFAMPSTATGEPKPSPMTSFDWSTRPRPGGNCMGPMSELVRFYEMLLAGGKTADGEQLLSPQTVSLITSRQRVGKFDRTFKSIVDWGHGFAINSAHHAPGENAELVPYGYGDYASRETFGHGGAQSSVGFADPEHGLAVGICFNGMPGEIKHQRRMHAVLTALYQDLGLV